MTGPATALEGSWSSGEAGASEGVAADAQAPTISARLIATGSRARGRVFMPLKRMAARMLRLARTSLALPPPAPSGRGRSQARGRPPRAGSHARSRPSNESEARPSMRPRARISASPTPVITAAMPSPNATTRTTPNAGRPPAIAPSRISNALVEGISPPASPSTNRLRQVTVVPVAGRWLWGTPP